MSTPHSIFNNLREQLDVMGYGQTLPLAAVPLVAALFDDLVKTTESLRDSKQKIIELLEEKTCWELGVEPYKCDNSRLLAQCNQLYMQLITQQEKYEEKLNDLKSKCRDIQTDKLYLKQQCEQLEQQLKALETKAKDGVNIKCAKGTKPKKPFITAVRSGDLLPTLPTLKDMRTTPHTKCSKCCFCYEQRRDGSTQTKCLELDLQKLENTNKKLTDLIKLYEQKIEARENEIIRLNDLLSGGRSPVSLARECCYKNIDTLTEDLNLLNWAKLQSVNHTSEYESQMHDAMQKALNLEKSNRQLQKQLDDLKEAALSVEAQANTEIADKESEIDELKQQLKKLQTKVKLGNKKRKYSRAYEKEKSKHERKKATKVIATQMDKHCINEKLNELTQRESELKSENERLRSQACKLQHQLQAAQKEHHEVENRQSHHLDEAKIRLKSERDFFQNEYLRLLDKVGSEKEMDSLQAQIQSKDEELRALRSELCLKQAQVLMPCHQNNNNTNSHNTDTSLPSTARSILSTSDCVPAVILRIERERDCARNELQRVRCERDKLKEKLLCTIKGHDEQMKERQDYVDELNCRLRKLERENCELNSIREPIETRIVMLKEDMEFIKQENYKLREENIKLIRKYDNLKLLHEQTENSLRDCQKKHLLGERQLEAANTRFNTINCKNESRKELIKQLHSEVAALKDTYATLKSERDNILMQLHEKTEQTYQLENEFKTLRERSNQLENQVQEMEIDLCKLQAQTRERNTELHESSAESKSLRQKLNAIKTSRDQAITENIRLSNDLAEVQAEHKILERHLQDSEREIADLKEQLHQYVQKVKKAEDLLINKEKEREEMLEHYQSLSQDAVLLEGNNQSLENEAAEQKRQINEFVNEIGLLKKELLCRNNLINGFEDKIVNLNTQITCLEHQLEAAHDDQSFLKTDLTARIELCNKLDDEKDKLNAELKELNEIKEKLENENDDLRQKWKNIEQSKNNSSETLEELLSKTRRDLEEQIIVDGKLTQELICFKEKNQELLRELELERFKCQQHESLAREYQVQNQELRHNLTDEHFRQARSREQKHYSHTKTM